MVSCMLRLFDENKRKYDNFWNEASHDFTTLEVLKILAVPAGRTLPIG